MHNQTSEQKYDSRPETVAHILRVRELLYIVQNKLEARGFAHDQSKLREPEKGAFDAATDRLRGLTYGSPEYKASLAELAPALEHHYANNSHHPEFYGYRECNICFTRYSRSTTGNCISCGNGQFTVRPNVDGMTLLDVVEMLVDWKAATERHDNGDIRKSLETNTERFGLSPQLKSILANTIKEMGW